MNMTATEKNTGTLVHLSALSQFIIPFGNFILPIVIWSSQKKESEFIDYNGKQAINFQLSLLLYNLVGFLAAGAFGLYYLFNVIKIKNLDQLDIEFENYANPQFWSLILIACIAIGIYIFSKITEFILIIIASVKASNGEKYKYPLTINFLK
jgi:uncharacterized protein